MTNSNQKLNLVQNVDLVQQINKPSSAETRMIPKLPGSGNHLEDRWEEEQNEKCPCPCSRSGCLCDEECDCWEEE